MTIETAIDMGYEDHFTLTNVETLKHIRCDAGFHILGRNVCKPNKVLMYCDRIAGPMI